MDESETTSTSNWQSDKGRWSRKARRAQEKGHFHFGLKFVAVKVLKSLNEKQYTLF